MLLNPWKAIVLIVVATTAGLLNLVGCTDLSEDSSTDDRAAIGTVESAITFPEQVTGQSGDPTADADQSETELAFATTDGSASGTPVQVVAYNDATDFSNPNDRAIHVGWSYSVNGGPWQHRKPALPAAPDNTCASPPCTYRQLMGDPALTAVPSNRSAVIMSSLAQPQKDPDDNSYHPDPTPSSLDACIFASADGGQTFNPFHCLTPPPRPWWAGELYLNSYDGGSLTSVGPADNQYHFAAYTNVRGASGLAGASAIHLFSSTPNSPWRIFRRTTGNWDPFPSALAISHPKLAGDPGGRMAIVAQVATNFSLKYRAATIGSGFIGAAVTVATGTPFTLTDGVDLGGGIWVRQGPAFDVALGLDESGQPEARIVYVKHNTQSGDGRLHIYGARCTVVPNAGGNLTCTDVPQWSTEQLPSAHQEFNPRIGYGNGKWVVSYYMSYPSSDPSHVRVTARSFVGNSATTYKSKSIDLVSSFPACPQPDPTPARRYWTDYDDIRYNDSEGAFVTTFAYNATECSQPTHVQERQVPSVLWVFP